MAQTAPRTTRPRKAPQDHRRKPEAFEFTGADGKTYSIPPPSDARSRMSIGQILDAAVIDDQSTFALQSLAIVSDDMPPAGRDALRQLSADHLRDLVNDWFAFYKTGAASGPQS